MTKLDYEPRQVRSENPLITALRYVVDLALMFLLIAAPTFIVLLLSR